MELALNYILCTAPRIRSLLGHNHPVGIFMHILSTLILSLLLAELVVDYWVSRCDDFLRASNVLEIPAALARQFSLLRGAIMIVFLRDGVRPPLHGSPTVCCIIETGFRLHCV